MPCRWTRSRNSGPARLLAGLLALGVALGGVGRPLPGRAHAADSDAVTRAREHYKNGEKAFKANRFEDALREWEAGYQLSNRPLFLLNMGHAERRRGQLGNARTLYKRFLLMEPESKLRGEIEGVLHEIDSALAAEESGSRREAGAAAVGPPDQPPAAAGTAAKDGSGPLTTSAAATPPSPAALVAQISAGTPQGDLADTRAVRAQPAPATPVYRRWWFWAGSGAVVALGALAGVLLLRGDSYTKAGSIGTVGTPP